MQLRGILTTIAMLAGCSAAEQPVLSQNTDSVAGTLLVANKRGNTLTRIDLTTGKVAHEVSSCANPHELSVSPDRRHVALACYGGEELEIFRTVDLVLVKRIKLGDGAEGSGSPAVISAKAGSA